MELLFPFAFSPSSSDYAGCSRDTKFKPLVFAEIQAADNTSAICQVNPLSFAREAQRKPIAPAAPSSTGRRQAVSGVTGEQKLQRKEMRACHNFRRSRCSKKRTSVSFDVNLAKTALSS
jgi:hypothetical protein